MKVQFLIFFVVIDACLSMNVPILKILLGQIKLALSSVQVMKSEGALDPSTYVKIRCITPTRNTFLEVKYHDPDVETLLDTSKDIMYIIHGHNQSGGDAWMDKMATDAATFLDLNACIVDWGLWSQQACVLAEMQIAAIGTYLGEYIEKFANYFPVNKVEVVGNGIGAHIAGNAGCYLESQLYAIFGINIPHLTDNGRGKRPLDAMDAQFTQSLNTVGTSASDQYAQQNWYANGNKGEDFYQPGCNSDYRCSLDRGFELFRYSMNSDNAYFSTDLSNEFGYFADELSNDYEFLTSSVAPYTLLD